MKAELLYEYQKLINETNLYHNNGSRVKDVKKLRFMAIMKAAAEVGTTVRNLRVKANENFHKYVVDIVYIDAVLNKNRQARESKEFFQRHIQTNRMEICAPEILSDNLVNALTPEKINIYLTQITGYGKEHVLTRDLIAGIRQARGDTSAKMNPSSGRENTNVVIRQNQRF